VLAVREGGTSKEKANFSDKILEGGDEGHGLGELAEGGEEEGEGGGGGREGEDGGDFVEEVLVVVVLLLLPGAAGAAAEAHGVGRSGSGGGLPR